MNASIQMAGLYSRLGALREEESIKFLPSDASERLDEITRQIQTVKAAADFNCDVVQKTLHGIEAALSLLEKEHAAAQAAHEKGGGIGMMEIGSNFNADQPFEIPLPPELRVPEEAASATIPGVVKMPAASAEVGIAATPASPNSSVKTETKEAEVGKAIGPSQVFKERMGKALDNIERVRAKHRDAHPAIEEYLDGKYRELRSIPENAPDALKKLGNLENDLIKAEKSPSSVLSHKKKEAPKEAPVAHKQPSEAVENRRTTKNGIYVFVAAFAFLLIGTGWYFWQWGSLSESGQKTAAIIPAQPSPPIVSLEAQIDQLKQERDNALSQAQEAKKEKETAEAETAKAQKTPADLKTASVVNPPKSQVATVPPVKSVGLHNGQINPNTTVTVHPVVPSPSQPPRAQASQPTNPVSSEAKGWELIKEARRYGVLYNH